MEVTAYLSRASELQLRCAHSFWATAELQLLAIVPRFLIRRRAPGLPIGSSIRSEKRPEIRRSYRPELRPLLSFALADTGSFFGALIFSGGISPDRSIACCTCDGE